MKYLSDIIETIKAIKGFDNDYQVAQVLGIKPKSLATSKTRNSLPYDALMSFCNNEGISLNWLLFDQGPQKVVNQNSNYQHAPKTQNKVQESMPIYTPEMSDQLFRSDQKINIDEAMGKAFKVLNAGTALSVALYMNIQQFAAALDTGQELKECKDLIKAMQEQIDTLNKKVDRLSAAPSGAEGQGDGSVKQAM